MRVALACTGATGLHFLQALGESSRHVPIALLQNGRLTRSRAARWFLPTLATGLAARSSVWGLARSQGLPIFWLDKLTDVELDPLRALSPDLILVGAFGIIFKRPLLDLPRVGCVNCHPSLLPRHRGPHPQAWTIIHGDAETGVTFHAMTEGIDDGDVLDQVRFLVHPEETFMTLSQKAAAAAGERVLEVLDRIEDKGLRGAAQSTDGATYDPRLAGPRAVIQWERPAAEIQRLIRACPPPTYARFRWRGQTVYVMRATHDATPVDVAPGVVIARDSALRVATGEGTLHIQFAYTSRPLPWVWPSILNRVRVGDRLE